MTMDSEDALNAAQALPDATLVAVHNEGWVHLKETQARVAEAFTKLGAGELLTALERGRPLPVAWPIESDCGARSCSWKRPSAVIPAKPLSDEGARARAVSETEMVNTKSYFICDTAIRQGHDDLLGGLRDDWFATDHHRALFLGGLKKLTEAGVPDVENALIIVGLPSTMYASHKAQLAEVLSALVPQVTIKVMP